MSNVHGTRKGDLRRTLIEAMRKWVYEKRQEKIARDALKLIEQNFKFGKRLYKHRYELYE
ncbi:MAG: hypothetical protein KKG76_13885 [Euryarchaeota archaeon]|nr:hypothetical protein [Euryarchaeota archaeon]